VVLKFVSGGLPLVCLYLLAPEDPKDLRLWNDTIKQYMEKRSEENVNLRKHVEPMPEMVSNINVYIME
jgi:hypothetical protein